MIGFVALFIAFYLAAPKIAERFGDAFEDIGEHAILVAPLLLIAFPLFVMQEPRAASPVMMFPALFALVALIVWRAFAEPTGRLYFIAAFFALVTEAAWSAKFLIPETLPGALATYGAFALLYLGVPHLARRRGTPLARRRPRRRAAVRTAAVDVLRRCARRHGRTLGPRAAARDSQRGAVHRKRQRLAAVAGARRQPRVVGGAAGVVVGGGRGRRPAVVAAHRRRPRAGHGRRLLWGLRLRRAETDAGTRARPGRTGPVARARSAICSSSASPSTSSGRCRRGRSLARLAVIALAFSVAALAARSPGFTWRRRRRSAVILVAWRDVTQPFGWAAVGDRRIRRADVVRAGLDPRDVRFAERGGDYRGDRARGLGDQPELMMVMPQPAPFPLTVAAHVIGFRPAAGAGDPVRVEQHRVGDRLDRRSRGRGRSCANPTHTGRDVLTQAAAIYALFAIYPLILGRARRTTAIPTSRR